MEATAPEGPPPDLKLVAHPRAKSKVWKYFGFDTNADGCILHWKRIYCRICRAQIAYSGNTSNLSYHLEKNHPEEFCKLVKSNREHMREAFASAFSKLKPEASASACGPPDAALAPKPGPGLDGRRQQELTAAVLGLLCEGLYPASLVDEPTFRALLRAAEPRYELPGRKFFSGRAVPERYAAVRHAVLRELAEAAWCGVSTDLWRSPSQSRTYLTLTAHFLSAGAPLGLAAGSRCLKTFEVPEDHAAEAITRLLYEAFVEWGIGTKVAGATTDAGEDVAKACSLLDVPVQVPCLGRSFEAAVQRALRLPRLAGLLARCGRLVEYFQQSPVARALLFAKQRQQNAAPCMLVSDRVRWWGSSLAMLERLREQQFAVAGVLVEDSNNHHLMLEAAEWAAVDGLVELLRPLQQVAEALCACRYPTISMVKPLLHMLLSSTLAPKDTDAKELSMAKELMAKELAAAYQQAPEVDMFLNVATFLDPRYKRLPFLSALDRQQVENRVLEEAKALLEKRRDGSCGPPEDPGCAAGECHEPPAKRPTPATATATAPGSAVHDMLAEIFCPAGGADPQEEWHAQVAEELSNFKSQKPLGLSEDPLRWWADRLALFPVLPKVLQKYWCVPATRVAPERLFASSANVLSAKRNRLAPAHVDLQVFLYENSRAGLGLAGGTEPEPEEEDEGAWGLDQEPACLLGDGLGGGFP
ncbi:PREDICTED: zinc finger BED domain-containing protein 1 [Chinchilla lanigera]|uniref:zinc finger BED domain-containing protein 1 n=1 Tax=Chinchilla lanigera TaxID=34839 RepID=UPI0006973C8F|nr:PREDICTED: zinc finger BED domain-containing protein 1 [Chinchilla lanigera]